MQKRHFFFMIFSSFYFCLSRMDVNFVLVNIRVLLNDFKEGGIIKIISTFVYLIKLKRCERIIIQLFLSYDKRTQF